MSDYDLDYFKSNRKAAPRHVAPKGKGRKGAYAPKSAPESRRNARTSAPEGRRREGAPVNYAARNVRPEKRKGRSALTVALTMVALIAVAVSAGVVMFNIDRENRKNRPFAFSQGVSVSGIDISGLSYEDALEKLKDNRMSAVKGISIDIVADEYEQTLSKGDFSYEFEYKKALNKAKIYSLKEQGIYETEEGQTEVSTEPVSENPDFTLNYEVDVESIKEITNEIANRVYSPPVNARVSKFRPFAARRFSYKAGRQGSELDREDLQNQITYFFDRGQRTAEIEAVVNKLEPDISLEDVKNNITGLSTATSVSSNNANGNHNMATALKACNGSVIEPGEVWSFNGHTGNSNLESNGYKKADVINNKKIEQGVGGGICQASTVIFKSALFANMAVVERHNHYWASSYAYAGEDATIDYPNLDLKLKNPTQYQMFMECKMEGATLTVNIYGYQEPSYDNIKLISENHDIEKEESYKTTTTRVLYLDGEIVSQEVVCNSTYSLKDDHSVRPEDEGSFRKTVDGRVKYEKEPETTAPAEEETEESEAGDTG